VGVGVSVVLKSRDRRCEVGGVEAGSHWRWCRSRLDRVTVSSGVTACVTTLCQL
jgi:hypothetical protein